MATAHDPDGQDTSPYLRVPWPLAALGILVVLGVFLGLGLWANSTRRSTPVGGATSVVVPIVAAVATPVTVETQRPISAAVMTPTVLATAGFAEILRPNSTARPEETLTATSPSSTAGPAAETELTPRPTVVPALAEELDAAYERYWHVRAHAFLALDASELPDVAADDHLTALEEKIDELRSTNRAIATYTEHKYVVLSADSIEATVVDVYVDKSFYVDSTTHKQVTEPINEELNEDYDFRKIDDSWRVVRLVRSPS